MRTFTCFPLIEPNIDRKSLVYLKYCTLYKKTQDVKIKIFARLHTLPAVKASLKNHKQFKSTTLCRQIIVKYENIIKGSKPKSNKNIFDVFVSPWAILNFNEYSVISPFSDMTLHFFDTTTTGF